MTDDTTRETDEDVQAEHEVDSSTMAKIVAPLATIAVAAIVRRSLDAGYRKVTGHQAPRANDRTVPLRQVLLWAAVTAAAVAVASVVVDRLAAPHEHGA